MILVDTTVWIDFFLGRESRQAALLESLLRDREDICLCGVILTEILQGIRDEKEYERTVALLEYPIFLPMTRDTFQRAANLYRSLRAKGITVRKTNDCLIAAVAIENGVPLLHNDRDFEPMERYCGLQVPAGM